MMYVHPFVLFPIALTACFALPLHANGGGEGEAPSVLEAVAPPAYPATAAQARVGGKVFVDVTVSPQGEVLDAAIANVEGPTWIFKHDWYALLAREWRFASSPRSQPRHAKIEFVFRLLPRGTPREKLGTVFTPPYRIEVREEEPATVTTDGSRERN